MTMATAHETLSEAKASGRRLREAPGVAILMNGGPGTVWGPQAFDAFGEFAASEKPGG